MTTITIRHWETGELSKLVVPEDVDSLWAQAERDTAVDCTVNGKRVRIPNDHIVSMVKS